MTKIKVKSWGDHKPLLEFQKFLDSNFLCFISPLRPSDQGGAHFYADLIIDEAWREKPATPKQLLVLMDLGQRIEDTITRGEASDLIQDQMSRRAVG